VADSEESKAGKRNMPQKRETLSTRVTRLEEKHSELADLVKVLLDAQIKTEARFQQTGERIEKLVIAIGELIHRNGKTK